MKKTTARSISTTALALCVFLLLLGLVAVDLGLVALGALLGFWVLTLFGVTGVTYLACLAVSVAVWAFLAVLRVPMISVRALRLRKTPEGGIVTRFRRVVDELTKILST